MTNQELKMMDEQYVLPTYGRFDVCLVKGSGCWGEDAEGRRYLDFSSGIGVNSLGWADAEWAQAVAQQAACLQHTSNLYFTQPGALLAKELCLRTGMNKVFFANSGAEANEGAIKAARKYSLMHHGEGRHTVISLVNSFHGRTMATLSATGQEQFHNHFHPFLQGFKHVDAGNISELEKAADQTVCAIMLEVIQGEGGVLPLDKEYLAQVQKLCRQRDILLICDEVQTGVGRTGSFLASEQAGIQPDIVTLAKGLGSGLPIGAILFNQRCEGALQKGDHATTYGANPVCCAGALVVMKRMTPEFLQSVAKKGELLRQKLLDMPQVAEVRGGGLMLGISFKEGISAAEVLSGAMQKGLLCLLAKDSLRLLPPLVVSEEEINSALDILAKVIGEL